MVTLSVCWSALLIIVGIVVAGVIFVKLSIDAADDRIYAKIVLSVIAVLTVMCLLVGLYFAIAFSIGCKN